MRRDIVGLSMRPCDGTLKLGASVQLNLLAQTRTAATDLIPGTMATWSSSDDRVAEVNRQGRLTPRAAGSATITAMYAENETTGLFTVVD
jgi:uncharacterized protein YjdB